MIKIMNKSKLEYIWLDGYKPTQSLRSKTLVKSNFSGKLDDCPMWAFDGSSTQQAEGNDSDCLLKPVAIYPDPGRYNGYLVMNEVLNADTKPNPWKRRILKTEIIGEVPSAINPPSGCRFNNRCPYVEDIC